MEKIRLPVGLLTVFLFPLLATELSHGSTLDSITTIIGEQKNIGNGSIRTWLTVDKQSKEPRSIGVTLTESALSGLPADSDEPQEGSLKLRLMDGGPNHTFEYELKFPPEAAETAFSHMGFNCGQGEGAKRFTGHGAARGADNACRKRNLPLQIPMEKSRQQLALGQITGGAEDDEIEDFDRNSSRGHILLRFRF